MTSSCIKPTRKRKTSVKSHLWTPQEDELLFRCVDSSGIVDMMKAQQLILTKTRNQIAEHWNKCLDPKIVKGNWTPEEDQIIQKYVQENGAKKWTTCAKMLPGRIGKQIRERWFNVLNPSIAKKREWKSHEDDIIFEQVQRIGKRWTLISNFLDGRTPNDVKNRWHNLARKIPRFELSSDSKSSNLQRLVYFPGINSYILSLDKKQQDGKAEVNILNKENIENQNS